MGGIEVAANRLPTVRPARPTPEYAAAKRIAAAVYDYLGAKSAGPIDPSTEQRSIPP